MDFRGLGLDSPRAKHMVEILQMLHMVEMPQMLHMFDTSWC